MSEIMQAVLRMPPDLFWSESPFHRAQHDAIRLEAADEIDRLRAEVERLRAVQEPVGYRLVPIEPTDDMLRSALQYDSIQDPEDPNSNAEAVRIDWSLMLDAAPHRPALTTKHQHKTGKEHE